MKEYPIYNPVTGGAFSFAERLTYPSTNPHLPTSGLSDTLVISMRNMEKGTSNDRMNASIVFDQTLRHLNAMGLKASRGLRVAVNVREQERSRLGR